MTSTATPQTPANERNLVLTKETDSEGNLRGLEPGASYVLIRKPSRDLGRERSREVLDEVRSFLHEHKVLSERQMKDLNEKYGEPAKAKVGELRATLEKRFDEMSKDVERLVGRLENDLAQRGILRKKDEKAATSEGAPGETPGELPSGGKNS